MMRLSTVKRLRFMVRRLKRKRKTRRRPLLKGIVHGLSYQSLVVKMVVGSVLVLLVALHGATAISPKYIVHVIGDDVGYNDFGYFNNNKTHTPTIDGLIKDGIYLSDYYTFKICSPSRAAYHTGRYPWGAGFYDMNQDLNHCTQNFTLLPQLLKDNGYATHAIGKYDIGFLQRQCTPTYRGYDSFYGYYTACQHDYWTHGSGGGSEACGCTDFSDNEGESLQGAKGVNGTYNRNLFSQRAVDIIYNHDMETPLFLYVAFMNVHDGCSNALGGKQAPLRYVLKYSTTLNDTYKVAGAMYSELDEGIADIVAALKFRGMWNESLLAFASDNGGPLDHCTNAPLRGGKHTFFEGGVRVMAFLNSPMFPQERRGTRWNGMMHSSDWYLTFTEGIAGGVVPPNTGPRAPDGFNLWNAIVDGTASLRTEVVHQVNNSYFSEKCQAIRMKDMKLIVGNPGDARTIAWPELAEDNIPFGLSSGLVVPGTDHAYAGSFGKGNASLACNPYCLFNLTADLGEQDDLARQPKYASLIQTMLARLEYHGSTGPPPAFLYPDQASYQKAVNTCYNVSRKEGFLQPIDL
eukprot:m.190352 g.190352  ORF g.190352 m.190352 type:complete len:575 (-) comp16939_c0_seq1:63-1787(-)